MSKRGKIILGIIMIIVGLTLATLGFLRISGFASSISNEGIASAGAGMLMIFLGVIIAGIGAVIIYLANMKKIYSYAAGQTAEGAEKIAHSVGKGLSKGLNE